MPLLWPWERRLWTGRARYRLPIFNTFNANHVRFVVTVYFDRETNPNFDELEELMRILGRFLALKLDEDCIRLAGRVQILAVRDDSIAPFLEKVRGHICDAIRSEALAFFLADPTGSVLRPLEGEETLVWRSDRQRLALQAFGTKDKADPNPDDRVKAWKAKVPHWIEVEPEPKDAACWMKLQERNTDGNVYVLFFPMIDARGRCSGVISIGNASKAFKPPQALKAVRTSTLSLGSPWRGEERIVRGFHDDDLARIDSILQVAIPRIETLQAEDLRRQHLQSVSHELKQPTMLIRGFLDVIQMALEEKNTRFDYDWIDDAMSWCDVMQNLVTNADYIRLNDRPHLQVKEVSLHGGVIAPLCRVLTRTLPNRGLPRFLNAHTGEVPKYTIEQGVFDIPKTVFVDKSMMQQVFFNLLENAIKYADPDRREHFHVVLFGKSYGSHFAITVQDWGVGIDVDDIESLFEEGVRASSAARYAKGTGFGLSVVRRLVEAHRGRVEVTGRKNPTELTVTLPTILKQKDWQRFI